MLYLDYAKKIGDRYILNFFANSIEDIAEVSNGKRFVTKNGTDYGVPLASSTIVITMPDKTKKTYVLNEVGEWQEGGVDMDYSKLENVPIILANLADKDFIPEANTYYEHLGETTENFIKGVIYFYDGTEYKAIDGSGSGGIQSDYNQNDSTALDYIKNRPFYEEIKDETLLEQTFTTTSANGFNMWESNSTIQLIVGDTVKVTFNGTEYTQEVKTRDRFVYVGNAGLDDPVSETGEPFLVVNAKVTGGDTGTTIVTREPQTNATIKITKLVENIHQMDGKFIKDMYYSTEAFIPFINFEVISGDINTIGSTMVVKYGDKEYTETVKDAAEQGSSEHKPYIGFKLGLEQKPTEEHPFCYGVNTAFEGNIKQLFCAAPKTVSENDVIVYNGKNKTVKKITGDSVSLLYVGNLHLLDTDFEDTGEQYLTLFDYVSLETQGQLDLVASVVPQDGISCEVKVENINYINPKYIKDMYYETTTETELFNGVVDINTEEASSGETYYTGTLSPSFTVGVTGDKCEVSINGNIYMLDVAALLGDSLAGSQDFSNGIPVYVATFDNVTTIGSKTSFTGANVVIKNIHTDIKQIPPKYISDVGYTMTVEIARSEYTDSGISTAIKNYLTNNADALEKIKTVNSFDLVLNVEGTKLGFRFVDNFNDVIESLGRFFVCLFYGKEDLFNGHVYLYEKTLVISYQSKIEVEFKSGVVYDSNIKFGVAPLKSMSDMPYDFGGKLGFFTLNSDQGDKYIPDGNIVSLPEWITLAQQRDDFAIPAPTKDTDLVDKRYVNNAISTAVTNAITTALNTEV